MKSAAFVIMVASSLAVVVLLAHIATVTVVPDTGLANPTYRIDLLPGTGLELVLGLCMAALSVYLYRVVAWADRLLKAIAQGCAAAGPHERPSQPLEVRRLKEAIRSGDVERVRRRLRRSALEWRDEQLLTPQELADLYGNEEIIAALAAAARVHALRGAAPDNRFATRGARSLQTK